MTLCMLIQLLASTMYYFYVLLKYTYNHLNLLILYDVHSIILFVYVYSGTPVIRTPWVSLFMSLL